MSSKLDSWTDDAAKQVVNTLSAQGLELIPKRVQITSEIDALGQDAWRLLLVLSAPSSETWETDSVFRARRAAIEVFDAMAADHDEELPGSTVAFVTTDEASEDDTAPADEPQPGEDPGRP